MNTKNNGSGDYPSLSRAQRSRKNRLERGALALAAVGLAALTLVQHEVVDLGPGLSESQGIVALVSINASVVLMSALIILILRGLYRVFFEERGYGSLQTKMVISFMCLSMIPTILIFYYAYRLIVSGHDQWVKPEIELALNNAIDLTERALTLEDRLIGFYGADILDNFAASDMANQLDKPALKTFLEYNRRLYHLTAVEFYRPDGRFAETSGENSLPPIYHDWFVKQQGRTPPWQYIVETESGDLTRLVWPVFSAGASGPTGFLAAAGLTSTPIRSQIEEVRHALVGYYTALIVQRPFRVTQLTALTGMSLLAIFISVWIGSHLARSLARPVMGLVEGTKKVAAGDLDFVLVPPVRSGEFTELVASFNQMTRDLKASYAEIDSRRRLVETVLKNVSTGVVVLDTDGKVRNLNPAARRILSGETARGLGEGEEAAALYELDEFAGRRQALTLPAPLEALVGEVVSSGRQSRRVSGRPVRLNFNEATVSLNAGLAPLRNEDGLGLGYLLTFDDLTELERAQRLAAWREVARRIAHEVKNPLTPIKLSAQRLRRRFGQRLASQDDA
ncbi:MAG: HAMP domain-containing protein, partial [Candidatus Adiutrix sp.]|nr:HAMP domain-containing protein [Candidatus Adiutrix sp.]